MSAGPGRLQRAVLDALPLWPGEVRADRLRAKVIGDDPTPAAEGSLRRAIAGLVRSGRVRRREDERTTECPTCHEETLERLVTLLSRITPDSTAIPMSDRSFEFEIEEAQEEGDDANVELLRLDRRNAEFERQRIRLREVQ